MTHREFQIYEEAAKCKAALEQVDYMDVNNSIIECMTINQKDTFYPYQVIPIETEEDVLIMFEGDVWMEHERDINGDIEQVHIDPESFAGKLIATYGNSRMMARIDSEDFKICIIWD